MTKLLALPHSWEIQRGGGEKKSSWMDFTLSGGEVQWKKQDEAWRGVGEKAYKQMFCTKQDPGASVLSCPHPKQSFTVVAQFACTALSEAEELLLERKLRQRDANWFIAGSTEKSEAELVTKSLSLRFYKRALIPFHPHSLQRASFHTPGDSCWEQPDLDRRWNQLLLHQGITSPSTSPSFLPLLKTNRAACPFLLFSAKGLLQVWADTTTSCLSSLEAAVLREAGTSEMHHVLCFPKAFSGVRMWVCVLYVYNIWFSLKHFPWWSKGGSLAAAALRNPGRSSRQQNPSPKIGFYFPVGWRWSCSNQPALLSCLRKTLFASWLQPGESLPRSLPRDGVCKSNNLNQKKRKRWWWGNRAEGERRHSLEKKKENKINKCSLYWQLTPLRAFLVERADMSPSTGGRKGKQAGSDPALVPRAARVTLKGAWQTLCSRRASSLALIHAAMQEPLPSAQSRPGTVTAYVPAKGDATLSWVRDGWLAAVLLLGHPKGRFAFLPGRLHSSMSHPLWIKI